MNITIRADASIIIGSGHIMRCLVLAELLLSRGHYVEFVCREQSGDLIDYLQKKEIIVKPLIKLPNLPTKKQSNNYEHWLQTSWQEDADEFMQRVSDVDLVIVDHYAITAGWEKKVTEQLGCSILAIDDLNREHDCNFILDQNLWADMLTRYQNGPAIKFLGPDYALLRHSFASLRTENRNCKNQVLAFFGGSDLTKECIKLAKAASCIANLPFTLKIIAGSANLAFQELLLITKDTNIIVEKFIEGFEIELKQSNYAIGASGVSNWERFCLQVPASIVSVADNQTELAEHLSDLGAIRYLGESGQSSVECYQEELLYLCSCWPTPPPLKAILVDGLGALRVVEKIEEALSV